MNHYESILKEIQWKISTSAKSIDPKYPASKHHQEILKLIQKCLHSHPPPETEHLLNAFRGKLLSGPEETDQEGRLFFQEMDLKLARLLKHQEKSSVTSPLSKPVRYVKGVGARMAALLGKLDLHTMEDLICFFPFRYEDRRNLKPIAELHGTGQATIHGTIRSVDQMTTPRKRFRILQVLIEDSSGTLMAKWFNQAYLKKLFQPGQQMILSGKLKIDPYSRSLSMENPEYEILSDGEEETIHTNRIVPIYHTTAGLTQRRIRTIQFHLNTNHHHEMEEFLPDDIFTSYHLPKRAESILQLHFPGPDASLEKLNAFRSSFHKRLIFEEFLLLELLLAMSHQHRSEKVRGISFNLRSKAEEQLLQRLSFSLTSAQKRVIEEIKQDMGRPSQMSRLLQGDVGCGKTIVAAVAAGIAMENGYQVAVMAPTEILAEQLYFHFKTFFHHLGKQTALLTGLLKNKEKKDLRNKVSTGEIDVVVGTQALVQNMVSFQKLGLVIIDEQHRFGVIQRAALMEKGETPDVLVMTATPIPRSLSLTVYGDLDISVIDEMPPGRTPVQTRIIRSRDRDRMYRHIKKEIGKGRQAYIVYPLVEETEKSDLAAATEMSERLSKEIFPELKVGLLHGRIKAEEKERIMESFKNKELHLLVSTTVVEVGIDIPNATIMVIEHAERFGLSQLHQLRGRVGRSAYPSTCYLVVLRRLTDEAARRLKVMEETTDGFRIAEEDLSIRGPGEFFGKKQSGMPELMMGNIIRDVRILNAARDEAFSRVKSDPLLQDPANSGLRKEIQRRYAGKSHLIRVG